MDIPAPKPSENDAQPVEILSMVDIDTIRLNPRQPRKWFDQEKLDDLADSIREHGVIEPVIVRPAEGGAYELVAGERRFRAAVQVGLKSIPAVARVMDDRESLEIAIIENVQREDINPVECAVAYRRLMDEFGLVQEKIAERVGKSRSTIANTLRLLKLPKPILDSLDKGDITEGHARALMSITDAEYQKRIWERVIEEGLSVRETERLSRSPKPSKTSKTGIVSRATGRHGQGDPHLSDVEEKLRRFLGTKVAIGRQPSGAGSIQIEFYDDDDLIRILDLISQ